MNSNKSGLDLFYENLDKNGFKVSEPNIITSTEGNQNVIVEITNSEGKTIKQNLTDIIPVYGNLSWYHFGPEKAILEIIELIKSQFEFEKNENIK